MIPRVAGNSLASEESILEKRWSNSPVGVELRCDPSNPLYPGRDVGENETGGGKRRSALRSATFNRPGKRGNLGPEI